tara:strand:- start:836 stop:1492 length:657 start_codon:yes stop_codon:yes gene_type:complete
LNIQIKFFINSTYLLSLRIIFVTLLSPNFLYSAYCDDGDIVDIFENTGIWQLDLNVHSTFDEIYSHQFLFTFDKRSTNSVKLSRDFKFPRVNSSSPKRHYSAKTVLLNDGISDVKELNISKFHFKQTRGLPLIPYNSNENRKEFCIFQMNMEVVVPGGFNTKYRLTFHAGERWQDSWPSGAILAVEAGSKYFQYDGDLFQSSIDSMVTGTLRAVEYSH